MAKFLAASALPDFQHTPLDLAERSIRLLRLIGGHDSAGVIECEIFEASLDEEELIPYQALSYVWGSPVARRSIALNGKRKYITANLFSALSNIRQEHDQYLWVDALCIDQDNDIERTHQVQNMARIYEKAEQVLVWLGETTDEAERVAISCINEFATRVADFASNSWMLDDPRWAETWEYAIRHGEALLSLNSREQPRVLKGSAYLAHALNRIFARPWFYRVWVLQGEISPKFRL